MNIKVLSNTNYFLLSAMVVMTAAAQPAFAQSSSTLSGLYACEALANNDAQLDCFRAETTKLRAAGQPVVKRGKISTPETISKTEPVLKTQKVAEKPRAEKPVIDESEKFIPMRRDEAPKTRKLTIRSSATYGSNGYLRFKLENGEIWQQMEFAYIRMGKGEPDVLTIKRAAMGSSLGRVNDKRPSFRLKRIK